MQTHGVEGLVDLIPCGDEVIALTAQAVRTVSISASLVSIDPVKKIFLQFPIYTDLSVHDCKMNNNYEKRNPRPILGKRVGSDGAEDRVENLKQKPETRETHMVSILASYWRASNWEPSGAEPAILFNTAKP